jgi:hypothetical protein
MSLAKALSIYDDGPRPRKDEPVVVKRIDSEHILRVYYQDLRHALLFVVKKRIADQWQQWLSWEVQIGPMVRKFGILPEQIANSMLSEIVGTEQNMPAQWKRLAGIRNDDEKQQ